MPLFAWVSPPILCCWVHFSGIFSICEHACTCRTAGLVVVLTTAESHSRQQMEDFCFSSLVQSGVNMKLKAKLNIEKTINWRQITLAVFINSPAEIAVEQAESSLSPGWGRWSSVVCFLSGGLAAAAAAAAVFASVLHYRPSTLPSVMSAVWWHCNRAE